MRSTERALGTVRSVSYTHLEQDGAKVIELWTGIPASRVQENELKKLANLEDVLKRQIIGQDEAVSAISAAIRRSDVYKRQG